MIKKMHLLANIRRTDRNRKAGVGLCGVYGRSLHNFSHDWSQVDCKKCLAYGPQEVKG